MITWLDNETPLPPVSQALPDGLLAAGGQLTPDRLLAAYRQGIFPWFNPGDPVLWWSPDPRMVLFPDEFKLSASLGKIIRRQTFEVRTDTVFEQIMRACAAPRSTQKGTWINEPMIAAYCELHRMGYAHSVEVWQEERLVGGLYGVAIGRVFYGESMYSLVANASKVALAHLANAPDSGNCTYAMIDCQMYTPHLASLGARLISRNEFIILLEQFIR